ncbi:hypothetical protein BDP27DRAFT_1428307 [Rhodocollybia butyracea]|uniref:Uncharacterized protein n=1 Tax=Rhodocollybia butyracea TaxID=206335 RepID=A0A9P5PHB1_9AGAR|nr:hypothetical protein BDP27DRAFT_1428307 [Rhodocollybia butyracea]
MRADRGPDSTEDNEIKDQHTHRWSSRYRLNSRSYLRPTPPAPFIIYPFLATALPRIASDFDSFSLQGWIATSFISHTVFLLFYGQLLRIFPAKWFSFPPS